MLSAGITYSVETVVSDKNTAKTMGSGTLDVFATPAMVALMEEAAWKCVAPHLDEGAVTVGTSMQIKHVSATPMGMRVTASSELIEVDGRRLVFNVEASDGAGLIGSGVHERFIIMNDKFMARTESKKG